MFASIAAPLALSVAAEQPVFAEMKYGQPELDEEFVSSTGKIISEEEIEKRSKKQFVDRRGTQLRRLQFTVSDVNKLESETNFWTKAAGMKVLKGTAGAAPTRVVGYDNDFSLEFKVNTSTAGLPMPSQLDYDIMQPTVDAMGYIQIGMQRKVKEVFKDVQASSGDSMYGDSLYLEAVSPSLIPVRLVRRPENDKPKVELVNLNVEVPAFGPVLSFYKQVFGLTETRYPEGDPATTKLSILLKSEMDSPTLLLSPVTDGRLKERWLDPYDGMKISVSNADTLEASAQEAVTDVLEEEKKAIENAKKRISAARSSGTGDVKALIDALEAKLKPGATRARPAVKERSDGGKTVNLDDGVGNTMSIASSADFI